MQIQHAILLPPTVLALLTSLVFGRLYRDRIAEMRARRIHPQQLASAKQVHETLQNVAASDNFRNLFEVPVLFYAVCGFLAITQLTTVVLLACAWGYVFLRAAHTYVHLTNNKVIRRFQLFFASSIVLYGMWALFAVRLLTA
jgi:hypothetical protein